MSLFAVEKREQISMSIKNLLPHSALVTICILFVYVCILFLSLQQNEHFCILFCYLISMLAFIKTTFAIFLNTPALHPCIFF